MTMWSASWLPVLQLFGIECNRPVGSTDLSSADGPLNDVVSMLVYACVYHHFGPDHLRIRENRSPLGWTATDFQAIWPYLERARLDPDLENAWSGIHRTCIKGRAPTTPVMKDYIAVWRDFVKLRYFDCAPAEVAELQAVDSSPELFAQCGGQGPVR